MLDLNLGRVLDLCGDSALNLICRHESCKRPELHSFHELKRTPGVGYRTRSKRHVNQPWQAQSASALRASVLGAVSIVEPRSFAMILREVRDDYGGCLDRSVHRHLRALCVSGAVIKLSWKHVHAYLLPGSKLIADPGLVYEQILSMSRASGFSRDISDEELSARRAAGIKTTTARKKAAEEKGTAHRWPANGHKEDREWQGAEGCDEVRNTRVK